MASGQVRWVVVGSELGKIAAGMESKAALILAKTATDIEAHAKARAPVDTGNLRSSIQAVRRSSQAWTVYVGAEYADYVEYGTAHSPAQPYWNPALNLVLPEFKKAWATLI